MELGKEATDSRVECRPSLCSTAVDPHSSERCLCPALADQVPVSPGKAVTQVGQLELPEAHRAREGCIRQQNLFRGTGIGHLLLCSPAGVELPAQCRQCIVFATTQ